MKMETKRRKICLGLFVILSLIYVGAVSLYAIELVSPATQLGDKRLHAEVYYRHLAKQDLNIEVGASGSIRVKNTTFTTNSSSELSSEGSGNGVMAKLTFQPFDNGVQYYALGGLSHYDLKIPSGSFSNTFGTDNPGFVIGGGIKYTMVPYTVVSPALSIDLSATHSRYNLTKFASGDGKVSGNTGELLTIFELQGALTASKKFLFDLGGSKASIDPYLGVKVIRARANLDESGTGTHFSGTRVGVAPFFGFRFKPFQYEGIVIEGSVLSEVSASIGLTFGF
jgi:hypothetical protein